MSIIAKLLEKNYEKGKFIKVYGYTGIGKSRILEEEKKNDKSKQ